ncbi:MAG: membrane protein insertase YidC [Flavobacteriaceae bacterium]
MEEKRFDPYQFIGFVLIALILTWMLYRQAEVEQLNQQPSTEAVQESPAETAMEEVSDSLQQLQRTQKFGSYAEAFTPKDAVSHTLENEFVKLVFNSKGAQITQAELKGITNYLDQPLYLIDRENAQFNIQFKTRDGRILNSSEMFFSVAVSAVDQEQLLSYTASLAPGQQVQLTYRLAPEDYKVDFSVQTTGLSMVLDQAEVQWDTKAFRNSKSIEYENRYTELTYGYDGDRVDYLSLTSDDEETETNVRWISYRQHFFSQILQPEAPLKEVQLTSQNLADDESLEEVYTKAFGTQFKLPSQGEINSRMAFYFIPTDYHLLSEQQGDLQASLPIGWGIFGWINRWVFLPLFGFLSSFLPHGIAIILMTVLVRLAMSPVTYKSYLSQIKMKVLRPEIEELNNKFKDDAVKRQQETMSLYNKAGVNPMSGCLPALLQLPVFYALFTFFPVAYALRGKSFLWANDLSSYDSVLELPFNIPFYGDHISLFPILASAAIFGYTQMTTGQQTMPQQPGMPNMKIIIYLMPLMMLFFFNNYASGLSLYYFVSNLLTIILMLVIKNYIVDDTKIHAQIEENKKKPKKAGGFSARLQKAMEEAEKQKKAQQRNKRR